jgi:hypothetical protein
VEAVRPRCLVEIGVAAGLLTEKLLEYGVKSGTVVHAIDPRPQIDIPSWRERYGPSLVFHQELSLRVLGDIHHADVVFIDGDHNWHTVYHELKLLEETSRKDGSVPPILAMHDVDWPYGRRDMYYDPDAIPERDRHPYRQVGISPSGSEPAEAGINSDVNNATIEGSPRNGVRTALEDFIGESESEWSQTFISGFHGLAVIVPIERLQASEALQAVVGRLNSPEFLDGWTRELERARIRCEIAAESRVSFERHRCAVELRGLDSRVEEFDRLQRQLVDSEQRLAGIPDLELRIAELERQLADANRVTEAALEEIRALDDRLTRSQRVLTDVFNSPSWRVTKPLRQAKQILNRN